MLCLLKCPIKYYTVTLFGHRYMKSLQIKFRTVHSQLIYRVWMIYRVWRWISQYTYILDDLMTDLFESNWCHNFFFTIFLHHLKITVIFVSRNVFPSSKITWKITLNLSYIVLFRSSRDRCFVLTAGWEANVAFSIRWCYICAFWLFSHSLYINMS